MCLNIFHGRLFRMFLISVNINATRKGGRGEEKCKRNLEELFKGAISSESLFFCGSLNARNRRSMKRDMPQRGLI